MNLQNYYGLINKGPTIRRPTPPVQGFVYYNTDTNVFEWYNGTTWVAAASGSSLTANRVVSGNTAGRPSPALVGSIYYNTQLEIFEWYNGTNWETAYQQRPSDSTPPPPITSVVQTFTTSTTSQVTVDAFPSATYRSAKYVAQMTSNTSYHMIELSTIHDGANVWLSQYGEIYTGSSLGTFDASITSGVLSLLFTPTNSTTTVNLVRTSIVV